MLDLSIIGKGNLLYLTDFCNGIYIEHLFSFRESGILAHARQSVPSDHPPVLKINPSGTKWASLDKNITHILSISTPRKECDWCALTGERA